jgi:hypothetical protein
VGRKQEIDRGASENRRLDLALAYQDTIGQPAAAALTHRPTSPLYANHEKGFVGFNPSTPSFRWAGATARRTDDFSVYLTGALFLSGSVVDCIQADKLTRSLCRERGQPSISKHPAWKLGVDPKQPRSTHPHHPPADRPPPHAVASKVCVCVLPAAETMAWTPFSPRSA